MAFRARRDILPAGQKKMWPLLAPLKEMGYCLYGGTALALRFGHRQSLDYDFFTERHLDKKALAAALPWLGNATILQEERETLVVLVPPPGARHEVKVSFFAALSIGRVGKPDLTDDGVVLVASIRDLLSTKLKDLFDRIEPKDYLDIAEILSQRGNLLQGISDARTLFGRTFSPAECLRTLCWFGEPELVSLPERCKRRLENCVRSAWDKPLPPSKKAHSSLAS